MQQIVSPIALAQKILGAQKHTVGVPYRLTAHCVRLERPEGTLLYHTLMGELVRLTHQEAALLDALPGSLPPALAGLVPGRFLVPVDADETALADQVRNIARLLVQKSKDITQYLIFTTTACNARCFYCFEAGIPTATMTEETARAAGAYIAAHCGGKPVRLAWFGGEPLLNTRAIDAICGELRRRGVEFSARMDSNGSLFDAALARRAKADWGLDEVQITVDGTEEVYNQRKAYVVPQGSPYRRVLRSIGLLLDAGVPVKVRLNMDKNNEKNLYTLVDELAAQFSERPGFIITLRVIVENKGTQPYSYTEEERCALAEKARALWAYLDGKGIAFNWPLPQDLVLYSCRSDKPNAATITPEGRLGRCESHIDKGIWGSVFSEDRDETVLRQWRARRPPEPLCHTCALYPRCVRLNLCLTRTETCSPIERAEMQIRLERAILQTFEEWKANHPARPEAEP